MHILNSFLRNYSKKGGFGALEFAGLQTPNGVLANTYGPEFPPGAGGLVGRRSKARNFRCGQPNR